jgi:penicillin-binding protein 1C
LVAQRACGVLQAMNAPATRPRTQPKRRPRRCGPARAWPAADCDGLDLFVTGALQRRAWPASEGMAPHLARRLLATGGARRPRACPRTCDAPCSVSPCRPCSATCANCAGATWKTAPCVVLDNASGEVLAWVGSSGELSQAAEVDGVLAPRQPGSTLKPFLYAQAIAEQRLTAASLLDDSPAQIPTASGLYIPQNYDRQFKGWVSVRTALGASLNVPAVRTLVMVSPEAFAASCAPWACPCAKPATTTATAWRWAAPSCRCCADQRLPHAGQRRALQRGGRRRPAKPAAAPPRPRWTRARPSSSATSCRTPTRARAPSAPTACWPRASGAP